MMSKLPVVMPRLLNTMLLAAALLVMPGCFVLPLEPKDKGRATDQYKLEMEFLPNSTMVSEDTSPTWDLGRKAFAPGTDRIIVIGRTTAYADKDEDGEVIPNTFRDRKLERVWITIASDIPLGKSLKLEELEIEFKTGYDVNNLDTKGFFSGPALMKGFVNLVEEGPDQVVVIFDLEVRPNRPFQAENWKVEGKHTIAVVPEGRIATKSVSRDVQVTELVPPPTVPDTGATTPVAAPTLTAPAVGTPEVKGDASTTPVKSTDAPEAAAKSIVGRWVYDTPGMDHRFQFGENGKFIYSSGRGDGVNDSYDPGMVYGTWEIKRSKTSEWLVLMVDRCEFNGGSVMQDFHPTDKSILLKMEWNGDQPIFTGEIPMARTKKPMRFEVRPGDFVDMNKVLPPPGRRKNAPPAENRKPYW